jgi:two-component system phosphate regulon response regulator PhoB
MPNEQPKVQLKAPIIQRHILVVEDDEDIRGMISYNLEKGGYRATALSSGEGAAEKVARLQPDLVVLDIMLPGADGIEVLKAIRTEPSTEATPVIMLTARAQEADKVVGLELGADDYMIKPFSPRELMARIKAVLRRTVQSPLNHMLKTGGLVIDSRKHRVTAEGEEVVLTSTEFRIIEFLSRHPGVVFTRERILDTVFGYRSAVYGRTVDTHIKTLRKKLGPARESIETVRGAGYRFRDKE